jgi:uncharacterized repeat protein (TIGR03803 family)
MIKAADGNLYGTTRDGGANEYGTVFRFDPISAVLTTLVEFTNTPSGRNGKYAYSALVQGGDGNFYGTTYTGGSNDFGTVFKMTAAGALTTLVHFTGNGPFDKGRRPSASLVQGSDDGPAGADFGVTVAPAAPVAGGASTSFTVRFAPPSASAKTAVLHIASNDGDESPFDIALTGHALAPGADEDGDGVTNQTELSLTALGFDPFVDSSALRSALHTHAPGLGLYRAGDMQTLALGSPVLARDAATGHFHLSIGQEKSADLSGWTPLTGFSATLDGPAGKLDVEITPAAS